MELEITNKINTDKTVIEEEKEKLSPVTTSQIFERVSRAYSPIEMSQNTIS
jgi:hypothetical protein